MKLNVELLLITVVFYVMLINSSEASLGRNWMKDEADNNELAELAELSILGTHNSCALYGGDYGACQSISLKDQLELGVRYEVDPIVRPAEG